jgi:predicted nucleic acid-binding protein
VQARLTKAGLASVDERGTSCCYAMQENLSAYQASYLVLAQQRALPLATADHALAEASRQAGVQLVDA